MSFSTFASFPSNSLSYPVSNSFTKGFAPTNTGLSEHEFSETIIFFENFWKDSIREQFQKELTVIGNWQSSKVGASTTSDLEDNPIIKVSGGLARHPKMNKFSLTLILCHELGHHHGGAPKSLRGNTDMRSWSSAEGQADYFAVSRCMKKIVPKFTKTEMNLVEKRFELCRGDQVCEHIVDASLRLGELFATLTKEKGAPSLENRSRAVVSRTLYTHPSAQCRLDTFIASLECEKLIDYEFDDTDYRVGACLQSVEPVAARPKCWFNPLFY